MGNWTPGPWWTKCNQFSRWEIHYTHGQLANVSNPGDPASPPESWAVSEANARLIAAAPELLEALESLLLGVLDIRGIDIEGYCLSEVEQARAAIVRATGGYDGR